MGNVLSIDRSITVNYVNGGYLYLMPNFIPFKFHNEDFGSNVNYKLLGNRMFLDEDGSDSSHLIGYTGFIEGFFSNQYIDLDMRFKFNNGLLRERSLNKFKIYELKGSL